MGVTKKDDDYWMGLALEQAHLAAEHDEVPIGAILVSDIDGQILSTSYNQPISLIDPTAHAEILCIRQAAQKLNNYRLINTTLYVTLEPCAMCAGALVQARIKRLVYAAHEPRSGAINSVFNLFDSKVLNHTPEITNNVRADESAKLLKAFFKKKR